MWDGGRGERRQGALSGTFLTGSLGARPCRGWRGVKGAHWGGHLDLITRGSLDVGEGGGVPAGCGVRGTQSEQSYQSHSPKMWREVGGHVTALTQAWISKHQPGLRRLPQFPPV